METPTPVSALLHAGIINAGGFLLIRFADLLLTTPGALAALVLIGGFTALFGGLVMLTQSAIKTSLAWSTVAQMGFMVLQCGLALFPLALLHIVAHSLYKAHAFLSSGWAVEQVAATRRPGPVAVASIRVVAQAFAFALALYALLGLGFGFADKSPQAIALGAILVFGVAYLIAQGLADAAPRALTLRTSAAADRRLALLLPAPALRAVADLRDAAADPAADRAGMGADRADAALLRRRRLRPGAVSALGRPSRPGRAARPSRQRLLRQRHLRPPDRRLVAASTSRPRRSSERSPS